MAVEMPPPPRDADDRPASPSTSSVSASPLSLSPLSLQHSSSPRKSALRPTRRVSFSDPDAPLKQMYPGAASAWDGPIRWALFFVAFAVRFYRLAIPGSVAFDELHFGRFVDNLLNRQLLFDIHPPLGKLTLAGLGYLAGYRPVEGFNYDEIGKVYGPVLYYPLREIAAMFGTLTVPLVYATARQLDVSWAGSLVAAGLFCFDNLNVIESRLILMDSQIMLYLVLSLYCALHLWKTPARSARRLLWLTVTGIVCGFSISVKWTALATPAMIAIVSFFGVHFLADPLSVLECAWAGAAGIAFYVLFFYVHFQVSVRDGPGAPFFADELRRTLVGHAQYDPSAPRPSFLSLLWYTNRTMLSSNASIMTRHTWESYWYQWVVNWRGLLYYNHKEAGTNRWASVYLMCNPIVCWLCGVCVAVMTLAVLFFCRYRDIALLRGRKGGDRQRVLSTCLFLLCGWLCNLLPYILVDRSAFVYHYLPGLLYAQLLTGVMIDQLPRRTRVLLMTAVLSAVAAGFAYFGPWTYCFPLTSEQHAQMRWFGRWD